MVSIQTLLILCCILESGFLSAVSCQCVLGDDQTESSEYTVDGGYLDIDHPATCHGNLTKWHFCYHSGSVEIDEPNSAWFRVWRQVSPPLGTEYTLVHNHVLVLTPTSTNDTLVCMEEVVGDSEQLEVMLGDIVGVYTPRARDTPPPLHIYGMTANGTGRLIHEDRPRRETTDGDNIDIAVARDVEEVMGITLHLYAEINSEVFVASTPSIHPTDQVSIVSTTSIQSTDQVSIVTSTQQPSPSPTSILGGNSGGGDGSGSDGNVGGIIAGVIVSLVVLVVIAAIIIIVMVMYRRRRGGLHKGHVASSTFSIDNNTYESPAIVTNGASVQVTEYEIPVGSRHTSAVEPTVENHKTQTWERSDYYPYPPGEFDSSDEETYSQEPGSKPPTKNRTGVFNIYNSFAPDNSEYCRMMEEAVQSFSPQEGEPLEPYNPPPDDEQQIYEELSKLNTMTIPQECISLSTEIESSPFGTVNQATMKYGKDRVDVMVKVLSTDATETEKIKFLQEAAIVAQFKHPNVMYCYGIIKERNRPMLVLEYPHRGRLIDFLIGKRPSPGMSTGNFLLKTAQQVALGMSYLSDKKFIHRLLCARSVFLSKKNICKIGEFGMSRDLADSNYYLAEDNPIPVKWMAPESVNYHKFSTASDVWSYGCLLYELWSLGEEPFHDYADSEVAAKLHSGYRLPPPPGCPRKIYELMINCWNPDPSARPTFRDLLLVLLGKETEVLSIPPKDATTHEQASILGAPLKAGTGMYSDLCWKYQSSRRQTFSPSTDGVPTFDNEDYAASPKKNKNSSQNEEIYEDIIDEYEDISSHDPPDTTTHRSYDETTDMYEELSEHNPSKTAGGGTINASSDAAELIYEAIDN